MDQTTGQYLSQPVEVEMHVTVKVPIDCPDGAKDCSVVHYRKDVVSVTLNEFELSPLWDLSLHKFVKGVLANANPDPQTPAKLQ